MRLAVLVVTALGLVAGPLGAQPAGPRATAVARPAPPVARPSKAAIKAANAKLGALGRQVATEVNRLRANPKAYAAHLKALRAKYDGRLLHLPGRDPIRTREGVAAHDEAIRALTATGKRKPLRWEEGLARAAADHARDIGARGVLDHASRDGSSPIDRVQRYGILQGAGGENIDVGFRDPRLVVIHLLIDDGVPDRGHRDALLDKAYTQIGVACAPHTRYAVVCVMDFADDYVGIPAGARRRR